MDTEGPLWGLLETNKGSSVGGLDGSGNSAGTVKQLGSRDILKGELRDGANR